MKPNIGTILFVGLSLALWLAAGMPGVGFLADAWIPVSAWLVLGAMATSASRVARAMGVDPAMYGPVALALGSIVSGGGAVLAAAMLLVAKHVGTGGDSVGRWATSPVLGAVFVVLIMTTLALYALLATRGGEPRG